MDGSVLSFGQWVKERREGLGLTRAELAGQIPCSADTINKIERGLRRPSVEFAERLAICLKVPLEGQRAWVSISRMPKLNAKQALWLDRFLPPININLPLTALIGREVEMALIKKRLIQEDNNLLTLVGPPGVGKTRLGLQAAHSLRNYFEDGVFWIGLAALVDPHLLMDAILQGLGLYGSSRKPALDILSDYLKGQQILLVLDNFEQICGAATQVCRLLERCRLLKIIVTSRLALRVRPERQLLLAPLAVPEITINPNIEALLAYPAMMLFIERAQSVNPDFCLSHTNSAQVVGILQRLDGLPLAIELIAARMKYLSPGEVYSQLSGRFLLGSDGWQDSDERQRTLQSAIEWSFRMLRAHEQRWFTCLGIFVGGWTLTSAQAVCWKTDDSAFHQAERSELLELTTTLIQHNLIEENPQEDDESRYTMLETIRQYALNYLQGSGELQEMRWRHGDYFLALIEAARPGFYSSPDSLTLVETEIDNLRAALRRSLEDDLLEKAARLAINLADFWGIHNRYLREGRQWLDQLLAKDGLQRLPSECQTRLLNAAGVLAYLQGSYNDAETYHQRALLQADCLDDKHLRAMALFGLSNAAMNQGDYPRVSELLAACLPLARQVDDRWLMAMALNNLAEVTRLQGDIDSAEAMFQEGLVLVSELNAKSFIAILLDGLGTLAQYRGHYQQALAIHQRSLRLASEVDDRRIVALAFEKLAGVFGRLGMPYRAAILLGASEALRREIAVPVELIDAQDYEHILNFTRQSLKEEQLATAWAEGGQMFLDEAVTVAIGWGSE